VEAVGVARAAARRGMATLVGVDFDTDSDLNERTPPKNPGLARAYRRVETVYWEKNNSKDAQTSREKERKRGECE
jgi:hypothetical protein